MSGRRSRWLRSGLPLPLLLLVVTVAACSGTRARRDVAGDYRLPQDVRPAGYSLSLVPQLEEGVFQGELWLNVTCRRRTASVLLHAHPDLNVTLVAVSVNPQAASVLAREIQVKHVERDLDKQWLTIMLSERLEKDNSYRIHLRFHGSLDNDKQEGLYRRKFVDRTTNRTHWYADTNMKLDSARRIFPCFDEPEFKAAFDVRVATPARQHVFASTPLADIIDMRERPGWYWKHFTKSPPMATMSFGLFLFEFEHYSLSKGVLRVVGRTAVRNDLEKALEVLDQTYEYFLDFLDVDDPVLKFDLVLVPGTAHKELACSSGLAVVNEEYVTENVEEVAYLLVGQWIGHLMTPQWWGELDVNYGIVLHLAYSFLEKRNYVNTWGRYSLYYEYAELEPHKRVWTSRDPGSVERASWFIRMIQYAMTEETFTTALRKFLKARQYDTFSEHDLWSALSQQAWLDGTLPRTVLVEEVARTWLTKQRFPVVMVTRNYGRSTATLQQHVFLRNKFYRLPDKDEMLWYIPIMYLTPDSLNVSAVRPAAWMRNQREITIRSLPESDEFIIINPAEIGMFMVNYDATNWALLAHALQRRLLPTAVRAKLLHDAWNLAFAGELNFNSAMNMTLFLKDEAEYEVWDVMYTMLDHVGRFLDGTRAGDKFKRYYTQLATRALEKLGDHRWSSEDDKNVYNLLRYTIRSVTPRKPTQRHRVLFDAWARGNGDVSAKTREAMCLTFKQGTLEEFERGLHRIMEVLRARQGPDSPSPLRLLIVCATQPEKIERLLSAAFLGQNNGFTDSDRLAVSQLLTSSYAGYSSMFSFLQQNFQALRQTLEDKPDLWVDFVENAMTLFKTEEGLKMAARLFAEKRAELGNAAPAVQAGLEEMTANVQWSRENVRVLEHWLDLHLVADDGGRRDFS